MNLAALSPTLEGLPTRFDEKERPMSDRECPFCELGDRVLAENALAVAVRDLEPASTGHTLIIPKRHTASFFDLTGEEIAACHALLRSERAQIAKAHRPDGYNIGDRKSVV